MLQLFKNDNGTEIIIDQQTGESFCSISGYARMSGLTQQAISKRVGKLDNSPFIKTAELDTGYGFKLHKLITEDLITDWIIDDNPEMAKQLLKAGVRVFLHKIAGFSVTSTATAPIAPQTTGEMFLMVAQQLVDQERRTKALEAQVNQLTAAREEAIAELKAVESPEVEVNPLLTRAKVTRLVKDYVAATGVPYPTAWNFVYREFKDRYHIDLKARARNLPAKFKALDVCEQINKMEELYAVAFELLKA